MCLVLHEVRVLSLPKQTPGTQNVTQSMKKALDKLCPLIQESSKESC